MLHILDDILKKNKEREDLETVKKPRRGSLIHEHLRDGKLIGEHDRASHMVTYRRKR